MVEVIGSGSCNYILYGMRNIDRIVKGSVFVPCLIYQTVMCVIKAKLAGTVKSTADTFYLTTENLLTISKGFSIIDSETVLVFDIV